MNWQRFCFSLLIALTALAQNAYAQTATSVANGNWTNPLTWDCTCVPLPGHMVTVAHNVTLNTDFGYSSGSITINPGASLLDDAQGRDMWINGGAFTNNGTADFQNLLTQTGAFVNGGELYVKAFSNILSFTNNGYIQADSFTNSGNLVNNDTISAHAFFNTDTLQNYGAFPDLDSLTNARLLYNHGHGYINSDSIWNIGTLVNENVIEMISFTNDGMFTNHDSILNAGSIWNRAHFINQPTGEFYIGANFGNNDPVMGLGVFENHGAVTVANNWANTDSVTGDSTGRFTIQNITSNSGVMSGSFDFCDLTPPSSYPYIDFNSGQIDPNITYCISTGAWPATPDVLRVYPNPAVETLHLEGLEAERAEAIIYDPAGRVMLETRLAGLPAIDVSELAGGLYLLEITGSSGQKHFKFVKR